MKLALGFAAAVAASCQNRSVHQEIYWRGLQLLNEGSFFDAHEVLEDVWREAPNSEKKFLQGLIQIAVGLHHYSKGNLAGAQSVLKRAHRNLSAYPKEHGGIRLNELRMQLELWCKALANGGDVPAVPQVEKISR